MIKDFIQEHLHGIVGTIVFHLAIVLVMLSITMIHFEPVFPNNPEGVEVNFGTDDTGLGTEEPGPNEVVDQPTMSEETSVEATKPVVVPDDIPVEKTVPVTDNPQDVATQNFEEAPAVATPSKIETKKKEVSPEVDEQQRLIEQENNKRIAAENQRKSQEKQNMAGRLFGKGSGNGSEGIAGGEGNQGKLNGVAGAPNYEGGGGKGVGYALSNRSAVDLPRPPKGIQAEGKVVVEILVDRDGNVIDARPGVKGSNTTNEKLYQASKNAAMKAKFNVSANSPERQKGTLTYIFELQ